MRLTQEQFDELMSKRGAAAKAAAEVPKPKRSKFGNVRCAAADGTVFGSKLERDYYEQLLLRWRAGEVLWFIRQVPFLLEGGVRYVCDFLVVEPGANGQRVRVIDTKGHLTRECANKLKQVRARYGIEIELVNRKGL